MTVHNSVGADKVLVGGMASMVGVGIASLAVGKGSAGRENDIDESHLHRSLVRKKEGILEVVA